MEKVFVVLVLVTLGYGAGLLHGVLDVQEAWDSKYACESLADGFTCRNR